VVRNTQSDRLVFVLFSKLQVKVFFFVFQGCSCAANRDQRCTCKSGYYGLNISIEFLNRIAKYIIYSCMFSRMSTNS
jgi:hypothetical protein